MNDASYRKAAIEWGLWGGISAAGYAAIYFLGNISVQIDAFFAILALLAGVYFILIRRLAKSFPTDRPDSFWRSLHQNKSTLLFILVFAVFFRLWLVWSHPATTDDIFRYIWDGRLMHHGIPPFAFAPDSELSAPWRDDYIYPLINHKSVVSIYPPLLQYGFLLSYWIAPDIYAFKVLPLAFDLGSILLLLWLLHHYRRPMTYVLIYAWNPLIILEFAGSAHVDIIGVFFLLLFLVLMITHRWPWAAVALAASILTKLIPILLLPFVWRLLPRRQALIFTAILGGVLLAFYLPFLEAGGNLFHALKIFASKWHFNASLFDLAFHSLKAVISDAMLQWHAELRNLPTGPDAWPSYRVDLALLLAKLLFAAVFLAIYAGLMVYADRHSDSTNAILPLIWFALFAALLMLATTVHPWYLAWIIPFLALYPMPAFLYLSVAILLSYHVLHDYSLQGIWKEHLLIKLIIYVPFYALLCMEWRRWVKSRGRS